MNEEALPGRAPRPKARSMQSRWMQSWQKVARRIRVPLGFITAGLYLFELWRRPVQPGAVAASLLLVAPGLLLRGYASGYVKKNQELTQTGPYAYTRNPLYMGSMLTAAGFAVALMSWVFASVVAAGFALIYIPVIASEERFLRATFPGFEEYCRRVPRLFPRLTPARPLGERCAGQDTAHQDSPGASAGGFSIRLYLRHHEYNALLGAALLYLSLLFLRPAVVALLDRGR
jgi:protein-S-isoprenylcysteine O-methyltransferase Ste14